MPDCKSAFGRLKEVLLRDAAARGEAEDIFKVLARRSQKSCCHILSTSATDKRAFELLWNAGGLANEEIVQTVCSRVCLQSTDCTFDVAREVAQSIETVVRSSDNTFTLLDPLVYILRACDRAGSNYKEVDERSTEVLDAISALLGKFHSSRAVVEFCLHRPTLESLQLVTGAGASIPVLLWIDVVLPFTIARMKEMKEQGVSGDQSEQEVVAIVRECARVFFIAREQMATTSLARLLFSAIAVAMSRGYSETERFPALGATILREHFEDAFAPSDPWIFDVLLGSMATSHQRIRAATELALRVLGDVALLRNDISWERDMEPEKRDVFVNIVAQALSPTSFNIAATMIGGSSSQNEDSKVVAPFVKSAEELISKMVRGGAIDEMVLQYIFAFVAKASVRCGTDTAQLMFHVCLQILSLTSASKSGLGSAADDSLVHLIEKLPVGVQLPLVAINEVWSLCGPTARAAFTRVYPMPGLLDTSVAVRAAAMKTLAQSSYISDDFLRDNALKIIDACQSIPHRIDGELELDKNALLVAAAPLLCRIALLRPSPALAAALFQLAEGAKLSMESDAMEAAHEAIRKAIEDIFVNSERRPLVRAVAKLSEKRSAVLFKAVVAISPEAKRVLDQLSRLTQQNQVEPAAEVYLLQEDAIVSSIGLEDFDVLCGSFDTFLATGDYLAALRTAAHIRDVYIDEYKGRRFESVVVNTLLPSIASSSINALPPEQAVFVLRDVMVAMQHRLPFNVFNASF
mmetsp:Transcript_24040/g.60913  ORF Transcript_24040/g.60913 Transcript_24040/m.60913 type:complete len:748 (-) Transcript_24040:1802-4045(-)